MTATSHPTLELLSDFLEDILPASERSAVEHHLTICMHCRSAYDELSGVRLLLRRTGDEVPAMPTSVFDQITSALRAETSSRTEVTGVSSLTQARERRHEAGQQHGHEHRRTRAHGRRFGRALAVAASVAVLAVGGTFVYQAIGGNGSTPPPIAENAPSPSRSSAPLPRSFVFSDQAVTLTDAGFDDQVSKAIKPGTEDPKSKPKLRGNSKPPPAIQVSPEACVKAAVSRSTPADVLDVARATYNGKPATLAITAGSAPGKVHAYVVSGCPPRGKVLHDAEVVAAK